MSTVQMEASSIEKCGDESPQLKYGSHLACNLEKGHDQVSSHTYQESKRGEMARWLGGRLDQIYCFMRVDLTDLGLTGRRICNIEIDHKGPHEAWNSSGEISYSWTEEGEIIRGRAAEEAAATAKARRALEDERRGDSKLAKGIPDVRLDSARKFCP